MGGTFAPARASGSLPGALVQGGVPRRDLALVAALGATLALPAVGYVAWMNRPREVRDRSVVLQASGPLEVRRPGAAWHGAGEGDSLGRGDQLRTGASPAVIDAAGRFRLTLEPAASAALPAPTEVALEGGAALLDVPAGSSVTVSGHGDAAAEVSGGTARFRVTRDGQALRVQALAGQVRLRGGGATLEVHEGRSASIPDGGAPAQEP
jgi:hypothetical protein